ncbi:MAG: microtubule-binding protein [Pseudobdellovibrionaceae bacterium]
MSFNYDKHKNSDHGSVWTSYSDLFLGLSIIFLLLYVTVSLRQGADSILSYAESKQLAQKNEDLKQQLKAYEALKQDYLEKSATQQEAANYDDLMSQLELLQDKAKEEKEELRQQAAQNEKKEKALNKYQQMIRNIINANMVAKGRIKNRDELIETQDQKIAVSEEEIKTLEQSVAEKRAQLVLGEKKITGLNEALDKRVKQLRIAYKSQKISQAKFEQEKKAIEFETQKKVADLRQKNKTVAQQLEGVNAQLNQTSAQLEATSSELSSAQANIGKLGNEKAALQGSLVSQKAEYEGSLAATKQAYQGQIAKLQGDYDAQRGRDKKAFDDALAREKLSGDQRAAREAAFKAESDRKARELAGQLANLGHKMKATELELARAQENLNAKKKLTEQIKKNFAASGIKAEVDERSGDVLLSFGDHYFDTDKAVLKPEMLSIIKRAMPSYSKSLFQDPDVAKKIQSVEIIGFASPTYKGKYIDPRSMDSNDRKAVDYNLDLSYARAKSIFNVVFDQRKMMFEHQKRLLPLVKVTGRSFLSDPDGTRKPASDASFCEKNDCAKLQRVIIKFNLKD